MPFFTKEEIIDRMVEKRVEFGDGARADFNLALLILGSALFEKRLKSGNDYGEHPVHVGMTNTRSTDKKVIGILHDVVEDSDWTLDDLRTVGFSERIVSAVDGMTHRPNEPYFGTLQRCGLNSDSIDKKIEDLSHNMDASRLTALMTEKEFERTNKYKIALAYLVSVKKGETTPGTTVIDFVMSCSDFKGDTAAITLAQKYSSPAKKPISRGPAGPF